MTQELVHQPFLAKRKFGEDVPSAPNPKKKKKKSSKKRAQDNKEEKSPRVLTLRYLSQRQDESEEENLPLFSNFPNVLVEDDD